MTNKQQKRLYELEGEIIGGLLDTLDLNWDEQAEIYLSEEAAEEYKKLRKEWEEE